MSDSLLPRIAEGDSTAMRECLDRYGGLVWAMAMRFFSNRTEAEDAVQEAFIDVWKNADRFRSDLGSEIGFITLLVRRRLIDRKRRAERVLHTAPLPHEVAADESESSRRLTVCDEARRARDVLSELEPVQRHALELAVCGGLTHQEVADQTGLPLGTVKTYIRRGLMHVRERMRAADRPEGER